jgi:CysZ protein
MVSVQAVLKEFVSAWRFVCATRRRRFFVVAPVFLNLILWLAVLPIVYYFVSWVTSLGLPTATWANVLSVLVGVFAALAFLILSVFVFSTATSILGAPFYGTLVEEAMKNAGMEITSVSWPREIARALVYTLKLVLLFVALELALLVLNIIPGIGTLLHFIGAFVVAILVLALEFFGEAFTKDNLSFRSRLHFLACHVFSVVAFAVPVFFLLLVPILNLIVPPLAFVAGSRVYVRLKGSKE